MALDGERRTPIPVGKRPSIVGGSLQALRLKRPELAILPPLLAPPSDDTSNDRVRRRRCSADEKSRVKPGSMATKGPVIDRTDIIKLLANSTSKKATTVDRIQQLERTILFLQEKHQELLAGLHAEVKLLKDKNRDLVYKLTLKQEGWIDARPVTSGSLHEPRPGSATRSSLAQIKQLEAQLGEAQTKLGEVVSRNQYLTNLLVDMKRYLKEEDLPGSSMGKRRMSQESQAIGGGINLHSSLKLAAVGASAPPVSSPTSLDEAESIIRALERRNEDYCVEIVRLRTELMNALSENEKLSQEDQDNGRWTRVEMRPMPGTSHTHRGTHTSRERLPRISPSTAATLDSRQSTAHHPHLSKHN